MPNIDELQIEKEFLKESLKELRKAYLAIVKGSAKSFKIDDREVTKLDLPTLSREIKDKQARLDILDSQLSGCAPRRAFGVVPMDW